MNEPSELVWLKACGTSACLEVAHVNGGVLLRDSHNPEHTLFTPDEGWRAFVEAVHRGEIT